MDRRLRRWLALGVVVMVLGLLIFTGMRNATSYYLTVDEYLAQYESLGDQAVQVKGTVVPGSVQRDPASLRLAFRLASAGSELPVVYEGVPPDTFQPDIEVVAAGHLAADGTFQANKVLVKCPSKYEAAAAGTGAAPATAGG